METKNPPGEICPGGLKGTAVPLKDLLHKKRGYCRSRNEGHLLRYDKVCNGRIVAKNYFLFLRHFLCHLHPNLDIGWHHC